MANATKVGDKFLWCGHEGRVMGIVEGYIVARLKGCAPFLMSAKEFAEACVGREPSSGGSNG